MTLVPSEEATKLHLELTKSSIIGQTTSLQPLTACVCGWVANLDFDSKDRENSHVIDV